MTEFERKPKRISAWQIPYKTVADADSNSGHPYTEIPGWLNDKLNGGQVRAVIGQPPAAFAGQWMLEIPYNGISEQAVSGEWIWCDAKGEIGFIGDAELHDSFERVPE